jgi:hypothetical protein
MAQRHISLSLFEEKKAVNPYIARFIESMAKTNT